MIVKTRRFKESVCKEIACGDLRIQLWRYAGGRRTANVRLEVDPYRDCAPPRTVQAAMDVARRWRASAAQIEALVRCHQRLCARRGWRPANPGGGLAARAFLNLTDGYGVLHAVHRGR
jgi:hypothetical protein